MTAIDRKSLKDLAKLLEDERCPALADLLRDVVKEIGRLTAEVRRLQRERREVGRASPVP